MRLPNRVLCHSAYAGMKRTICTRVKVAGTFKAGSHFWGRRLHNQGVSFATLRLFSAEKDGAAPEERYGLISTRSQILGVAKAECDR